MHWKTKNILVTQFMGLIQSLTINISKACLYFQYFLYNSLILVKKTKFALTTSLQMHSGSRKLDFLLLLTKKPNGSF